MGVATLGFECQDIVIDAQNGGDGLQGLRAGTETSADLDGPDRSPGKMRLGSDFLEGEAKRESHAAEE